MVSGKIRFLVFLSLLVALFCVTASADIALQPGLQVVLVPSTNPSEDRGLTLILVDVYVPDDPSFNGDILVLPGWNFPRDDWYRRTDIRSFADKKSFRLIFPDMGKTLYESRYYPETKMKWAATPGGRWVKECLIPAMQKRGLLLPGGKNYLLGLSTGGRGVALVSLGNPGLFRAGASLSGDFDQSAIPGDRLMTAVYGPFARFRDRWIGEDNAQKRIAEWKMPVYLSHGRMDRVVPFSQTETFYRALRKAWPDLTVVFHDPDGAGHDYAYWGSELGPVFDFFLSVR